MASTLNDTNISDVYKKLVFTMEGSATEADLWATDPSGDDRKITGFASALSFTSAITAEAGVILGNNIIYNSEGTATLTLDTDEDLTITGDLTVTGNIINSSSAPALTLSAANVTVAGDLTITGGNITNAITCDSTVTTTGLLTANANVVLGPDADGTDRTIIFGHATLKTIMGIDDSADSFVINVHDDGAFDGTIAENDLSINSNGNLRIRGDLTITGNDIKSSSATALTLSGANVAIPGTLTMTGNIIMAASTDLRFATQMDIHNGSDEFLSFASTGVTVGEPLIIAGGVKQSVKKMADADVTLTAADSGKYVIVEHATSASRDLILPAVADGLNFKVRISLDLANILEIKAAATGNFLEGGVTFIDTNTDAATTTFDTQILASSSDEGISIKADTKAGSWVELVCDGTTWFISGTIYADTAPDYVDV